MPFFKWLKERRQKRSDVELPIDKKENEHENDEDQQQEEEGKMTDGTQLIYFACHTPKTDLINVLQTVSRDVQIFTDEIKCIESMKSITDQIFVIIDDEPSKNLIEEMDKLKQIDSVFIYSSSSSESVQVFHEKPHDYFIKRCENESILIDALKNSQEEHERYLAVVSMFNKKNSIHDISKDFGSYLYFQLFQYVMRNLPLTSDAKHTIINIAKIYYRGNSSELANIDDFDRNYLSADAIGWYMKDTFLSKLINKGLCIEDVIFLYQFRFYIYDLSEQIQNKASQLREKQKDVLKLYCYEILTDNDIQNFQNNIGTLRAINGYLSLYSQQSIVDDLAKQTDKTDGNQRVVFEYHIDLSTTKKISLANVEEFRVHSKQGDFLVDIGASFQIDSCVYNIEEDLWYIQVHATDQGAELANEYIEYQKKRMRESSIVLLFGDLLIEAGDYTEAERYFVTILNSANPNDEEIACIFYYFGRIHRLQGDLNRAINCYDRAYRLHINGKPKRSVSAGKSLNGLGAAYIQKGRLERGEECLNQAMKLFKKNLPKEHVDIAAILINLSNLDSERKKYDQAIMKITQAKDMYDSLLPSTHPNRALPRMNLGNIYLTTGQYKKALEEYQNAVKIQEKILPLNHPDRILTENNIDLVRQYQQHMIRGNEPQLYITDKIKNSMVD